MIRATKDAYKISEEFQRISSVCLTELIVRNLEEYFYEGYETCDNSKLYTKVNLEKANTLFTEKVIKEMIDCGVNISTFIPKKIAQFMILLNHDEIMTPDIFLYYILYRMTETVKEGIIPESVNKMIPEIERLALKFAKKELSDKSIEEQINYVNGCRKLLTEIPYLLESEELGDEISFAFWDWNFIFIDTMGFSQAIYEAYYGMFRDVWDFACGSTDIFASVDEPTPEFIEKKTLKLIMD